MTVVVHFDNNFSVSAVFKGEPFQTSSLAYLASHKAVKEIRLDLAFNPSVFFKRNSFSWLY